MVDTKQLKPGQIVRYMSYGQVKRAKVGHVGKSGIVFLLGRSGFLFPESIIDVIGDGNALLNDHEETK